MCTWGYFTCALDGGYQVKADAKLIMKLKMDSQTEGLCVERKENGSEHVSCCSWVCPNDPSKCELALGKKREGKELCTCMCVMKLFFCLFFL